MAAADPSFSMFNSGWKKMLAIALTATAFRFVVGLLVDSWMRYNGFIISVVRWASLLDDLIFSLVWGTMVYGLMFLLAHRRHEEQRRATMVMQMNHHVRNALQIIELSAWGSKDREHYGKMVEAVCMIDWALREILPGNLAETPIEQHSVERGTTESETLLGK